MVVGTAANPQGAAVKCNLKNLVRQTPLGRNQALRPVYEAVANAFDAINELGDGAPHNIVVRVVRGPAPPQVALTGMGVKPQRPVAGFEIEDDGIGFTDPNFESFSEAHSDNKKKTGGKGCGRFLWLKAFSRAEVESVYQSSAGTLLRRSLGFDLQREVKVLGNGQAPPGASRRTVVRLIDLCKDYKCPAQADTIARHLVEHHLEEMLANEKVEFSLDDPDAGRIDLRAMFRRNFTADIKSATLTIKGERFHVRHWLVRPPCIDGHKLHLCARQRHVEDVNLAPYIADLKAPLEVNGESVYYLGTVTSRYLDADVTEGRMAFTISHEPNLLGGLTMKDIAEGVASSVRKYLKPHLDELIEKKRNKVGGVVADLAPELRSVVERHPELVNKIAVDSSTAEIITVVAGQRYADRAEYRQLQAEMHKAAHAADRLTAYKKEMLAQFSEHAKREATITLTDFVLHRRVVLDVLADLLGSDENGNFHKEEAVHGIIFPLRKTSDQIPPDIANLWVLDERLAFHHYLASDTRLDSLDPVQVASGREPDVVVFHKAIAATETPAAFPEAITLIEFKRPGRDNYTFDENPYRQVLRYAHLILEGRATDRDGKVVKAVRGRTRFFAYIVADFKPKLVELLTMEGFTEGVEVGTMFKPEPNLNMQIVAIDYLKMLEDAIRRNRSYFQQLGVH